MPGDAKSILVLGIGNILMSDDGIGVRVIEAMHGMDLPPDVELLDGGTGGLGLLDNLIGRRRVIVVDAMQSGAAPGTIRRLTLDDLELVAPGSLSLHDLGLVELMRAVALLGGASPEVVIFGIEPVQIAPGLELSPQLARLVPEVVTQILAELNA